MDESQPWKRHGGQNTALQDGLVFSPNSLPRTQAGLDRQRAHSKANCLSTTGRYKITDYLYSNTLVFSSVIDTGFFHRRILNSAQRALPDQSLALCSLTGDVREEVLLPLLDLPPRPQQGGSRVTCSAPHPPGLRTLPRPTVLKACFSSHWAMQVPSPDRVPPQLSGPLHIPHPPPPLHLGGRKAITWTSRFIHVTQVSPHDSAVTVYCVYHKFSVYCDGLTSQNPPGWGELAPPVSR